MVDCQRTFFERDTGIEPASTPWKGVIIPLYQSRNNFSALGWNRTNNTGLEDQSYIHLTTRALLEILSQNLHFDNKDFLGYDSYSILNIFPISFH